MQRMNSGPNTGGAYEDSTKSCGRCRMLNIQPHAYRQIAELGKTHNTDRARKRSSRSLRRAAERNTQLGRLQWGRTEVTIRMTTKMTTLTIQIDDGKVEALREKIARLGVAPEQLITARSMIL